MDEIDTQKLASKIPSIVSILPMTPLTGRPLFDEAKYKPCHIASPPL